MIIRNVKVEYKNGERYGFVAITSTIDDFLCIIRDYSSNPAVKSVSYKVG